MLFLNTALHRAWTKKVNQPQKQANHVGTSILAQGVSPPVLTALSIPKSPGTLATLYFRTWLTFIV